MTLRSLAALAVAPATLCWASTAEAHPDLYYGADDVEVLQARAQDETPTAEGWTYAEVFDTFVTAADTAIETPYSYTVDIPDLDGSGSVTWTYVLSAQMPGPHPNNPSYPPWTVISRQLENRLVTLAFVYAMTGDAQYLRNDAGTGAIDTALLLVQWDQWTDPYYSCGAACLDTAHLTFGMGALYDFAYAELTESERVAIRTAIAELGVEPLAQEVQATAADAWFNGYALRVAGLAVGASAIAPEHGAAADTWLEIANDASLAFVQGQGSDGGTFEGQLYGTYAVDRLVQGLAALERRGYPELFDDPWLRDLPRFAAAFLSSDLTSAAAFGDSSEVVYWVSTMFALAAHGDGRAQWYLQTVGKQQPGGILTFLWANPELAPDPLLGSGSAAFLDIGHAALRAGFDGAPVVAVKSGPPTVNVGHNHYDNNSFVISAHGQWIAADPGYRDYFNPSLSTYTVRTIGHNTIMVDKSVTADGSSTSGGQSNLVGSELDYFFEGAGYAKIVGRAAAAYDGLLSRFDRRIFYAKPDVVFVFDDLAAPQSRAYSWLLHAHPGAVWTDGTNGPAERITTRGVARLETFAVASVPWAEGYPSIRIHPGAESRGSYAEWRTAAAGSARIAAALVPGRHAVLEVANAGFEDGMQGWQPRAVDATHAIDDGVAHGGTRSGRIQLASADTGYFYSSPLTVTPGGTFEGGAFVRTQGAVGTISLQIYWMRNGSFIAEPAGPRTEIDAGLLAEFTEVLVAGDVPDGVDELRLALQFTGTGTVWFDDAWLSATDVVPPDPPARAVALGDPALGIAVEGAFGVHAGASRLGSDLVGMLELPAADDSVPLVSSLASDADVFMIGLAPDGAVSHVFVQGGSTIVVGGQEMFGLAAVGSIDVGVTTNEIGCARIDATEYPTLEAPPYRLRGEPGEVWLNGARVAFAQSGDIVTFPTGADLGPGCPDPEGDTDGSTGGAEDGGTDGGVDDAGVDVTGGATEGTSGMPGVDEGGGCGCRAQPRTVPLFAWLALACARRRRR